MHFKYNKGTRKVIAKSMKRKLLYLLFLLLVIPLVFIFSACGKIKKYTVIWRNHDGEVLEEDLKVPKGEIPKYDGKTPEKPADEYYTYTFNGWDPGVEAITKNTEYTATFTRKEIIKAFTVIWKTTMEQF